MSWNLSRVEPNLSYLKLVCKPNLLFIYASCFTADITTNRGFNGFIRGLVSIAWFGITRRVCDNRDRALAHDSSALLKPNGPFTKIGFHLRAVKALKKGRRRLILSRALSLKPRRKIYNIQFVRRQDRIVLT